ncbi:unnamed protein product [Darwinula stevensoni]|uniref:GRAM domain-containing protein n=1 Tax=Darwinula stevensoni TaxID=69355 RepID=A0A7R9AFP8_9CRUS|nr:unnamed protein product [Darwinula stevensoni]CAG0902859.1 unnamed protein product [Darwinula stevensoni]
MSAVSSTDSVTFHDRISAFIESQCNRIGGEGGGVGKPWMKKKEAWDSPDRDDILPPSNPPSSPSPGDGVRKIVEEAMGQRSISQSNFHFASGSTPTNSPTSTPETLRSRFLRGERKARIEKSKSLDQSEPESTCGSDSEATGSGSGRASSTSRIRLRFRSSTPNPRSQRDNKASIPHTASVDRILTSTPVEDDRGDRTRTKTGWLEGILGSVYRFAFELVEDVTFDPAGDATSPPGPDSFSPAEDQPLTVKRLKENVLRFSGATRPIQSFLESWDRLVSWKSPACSFLAFTVWTHSVIYGWFLSLLFSLAIAYLSLNYLRKREEVMMMLPWVSWLSPWGHATGDAGNGQQEDMPVKVFGDKFSLVLQVARKVQNVLGDVSDAAEKFKNLLSWNHEATRSLYLFLWCGLALSLVVTFDAMVRGALLWLGVKVFLVGPLFQSYPRLRLKYDSTHRLWQSLPTDATLDQGSDETQSFKGKTSSDVTFCDLFSLPATESPLHGWEQGKRCIMLQRDPAVPCAPSLSVKSGKAYLTPRYLCFQRFTLGAPKITVLPLERIATVEKASAVRWLPGSPFVVHVSLQPSQKRFTFGGFPGSDLAFEDLIAAGRSLQCPWASLT